MINRLIA